LPDFFFSIHVSKLEAATYKILTKAADLLLVSMLSADSKSAALMVLLHR